MKHQPIDVAIRKTLARRNDRVAGDCPDDNFIAAYLESRLQPDESTRFEAHASVCISCREVLALSIKLNEESGTAPAAPQARHKKVIFHFAIPVSALTLILVASFAGLLYYRKIHEAARESSTVATAEVHRFEKDVKPDSPAASISAPPSRHEEKFERSEPVRLAKGIGPSTAGAPPPAKPAQALNELRAPDKSEGLAPVDEFAAAAPPPLEADAVKTKSTSSKETALPPSPAAVGMVGGVSAPANFPQEPVPHARRAVTAEAGPDDTKELQLQKAARSDEARRAKLAEVSAGRVNALADRVSHDQARTIGGRTFTWVSEVWVDAECQKHPSAEQVQLKRDSSEFEGIRQGIPGIETLVTDTQKVRVFWKDKIYLVGP